MKQIGILVLVIFSLGLSAQTVVRWHTSMGNYTAELREDLVPITAYNFRDLTRDNFYDGLIFHRVIDGFVIQDGDPTGTGYGGSDETIPLEIHPELRHDRAGTLGMARSTDPNSASSQYYISLDALPNLDDNYAVFGYVTDGIEVVQAIGDVDTNANDHPLEDVFIDSIRVLTPNVESFEPANRDQEIIEDQSILFSIYCSDYSVTYNWTYDDEPVTNDLFFLSYTFEQAGNHQIQCTVTGDTECDYVMTWNIQVTENTSVSANLPALLPNVSVHPNPFNPTTTFSITNNKENGDLEIFNVKGQRVKSFTISENSSTITWDGKDMNQNQLSSGIYFYRLRTPSQTGTLQKCLLMK